MKVRATAKIKAVAPDPSHLSKLLQFLKAFRDWTQYVVDEIWKLNHVPSMRELHNRFYKVLREQGFRAHHCHKIERRAREVVKATKKNNGSKPVLKKLTARLDSQDYKINFSDKTIRIAVLNDKWVELKLVWYDYLNKYLDGSWRLKEILVSYRGNEVWIYLVFEKEVYLRKPETVMGIDINFDNVTYTIIDLSGRLVLMGYIKFNGLKKAIAHKVIAERIQRRYSKSWRFIRGVREAIRKHDRKARNILTDSCHYVSRRIVEIAREYNSAIVLEDLNKLRDRANGSKKFNKKLSLWAYRRIQTYIHYKALIEGLQVVYVNPRNTSKISPVGGRLKTLNHELVMLPNGCILSRHHVASWNIALRGLKTFTGDVGSRGLVDSPNAPDQMQTQEGMRGKPVPRKTKVAKTIKRG